MIADSEPRSLSVDFESDLFARRVAFLVPDKRLAFSSDRAGGLKRRTSDYLEGARCRLRVKDDLLYVWSALAPFQ